MHFKFINFSAALLSTNNKTTGALVYFFFSPKYLYPSEYYELQRFKATWKLNTLYYYTACLISPAS